VAAQEVTIPLSESFGYMSAATERFGIPEDDWCQGMSSGPYLGYSILKQSMVTDVFFLVQGLGEQKFDTHRIRNATMSLSQRAEFQMQLDI
jgi:hypothetical protein